MATAVFLRSQEKRVEGAGGLCSTEPMHEPTVMDKKLFEFLEVHFTGGVYRLGESFEGGSGRIYSALFTEGDSVECRVVDMPSELQRQIRELEKTSDGINKVALKILHSDKRRLRGEDRAKGSHYLLGKNHPNIASVYAAIIYNEGKISFKYSLEDINEDDKLLGYVQKWIEGNDLSKHTASLLEKGSFVKASDIRHLLSNLVEVFNYFKIHKIRHRDMSLQNILVDQKGSFVVTDFDYACQIESFGQELNCILGVLGSMSPEMFYERKHGYRSDYFSVGMLLAQIVFCADIFSSNIDNIKKQIFEKYKVTDLGAQSKYEENLWGNLYECLLKSMQSGFLPQIDLTSLGELKIINRLNASFISDKVTEIPEEKQALFDLIMSLLKFNPEERMFGRQISRHPFMQIDESVESKDVS